MNKKGYWWTFRLSRRVVICIVLLIIIIVAMQSKAFWRLMYPIQYYAIIRREASSTKVDPLLVAAIASVESKFEEGHISHAGAVGLLQLMPQTAKWIASKSGTNFNAADLGKNNVNIRLGSWYVGYLIRHFNGNIVAAVAAYNAGPNKVDGWLAGHVWSGQLSTVNDIPIGETRHFLQRVFYNYDIYSRVYR